MAQPAVRPRPKPQRVVDSEDEADLDDPLPSTASPKRKAALEDDSPPEKRRRTASTKQQQISELLLLSSSVTALTPIDKENLEDLQTDVCRAEKALKQKKKAVAAQAVADAKAASALAAAAAYEAEYESEDPMDDIEDDNTIHVPSRIMALPVIPPPVDKPTQLKRIKRTVVPQPRTKRFIALPELTPEQRAQASDSDDGGDIGRSDYPPPRTSSPPPRTSSPPPRTRSPSPRTSSPPPRTSSPPPTSSNTPGLAGAAPGRRERDKGKVPAFCDGFVAGAKPKASDYAPTEKAVILRACYEYIMRLFTINPFPTSIQQAQWAVESFKAACRATRERFQFTDRIGKILCQRGSSSRGTIIEKTRSLFATAFGMTCSTSATQIAANKAESERLLIKAAFYYKDTKTRTGYAENPIVKALRQLTIFKDSEAVGIIFASAFNPIPFSLMALEMTAIEVCIKEWQTGLFVQSKFTEKSVSALYTTHLVDVEKWSLLNPTVVENLRRRWYTKLTGTLVIATTAVAGPSNIDDAQEAALRAELEARTGDTDSEAEAEEVIV
ncbi:hypothetical protein C8F01DRAFT_1281594 [Mycena amicta]|nr:hypothetical protein C8F01DRAFT_1281594 [Mycena amicta]